MTDDGRGELLPPTGTLAGVLAWLKARPILVAIATLLLGLGVQTTRLRWREASAARHQKRADLLKRRNAIETARAREAEAAPRQVELDRQLEAADSDAAAGRVIEMDAHERLKAIGKRWPTKLVLLALLWPASAWAADPPPIKPEAVGVTSSCQPDPDLSGLVAQLQEMAGRLAGLDREAAIDAVATILARAEERAALCARLEAAARARAALEQQVTLRDGLLSGCQADRALAYAEWESVLQKPRSSGRGAFGFLLGVCLSTPIVGDGADDLQITGSGCWGWRP